MALPELYKEKTFDRDSVFKEQYGTMASKRDQRKFNKYWNSDQRLKDEEAFVAEESKKYMDSFNKYSEAAIADAKARREAAVSNFKEKYFSKPETQQQQQQQTLIPKQSAYWNQVAGKYGFKDMEAVAQWQKDNGLTVDGKFGSNSYAKWAQLNPNKVGSAPVIKPTVKPRTAPDASTVHAGTGGEYESDAPPGYQRVSRPDGTEVLVKSGNTPAPAPVASTVAQTTPKTKGFNFTAFAADMKNKYGTEVTNINGKNYVRYDPSDVGDFYVGDDGNIYRAEWGGDLGNVIDHSKHLTLSTPNGTKWERNYNDVYNAVNKFKTVSVNKRGGTMNRINYFQQGGAAPQQNMQQQVVALVQAAMQGDEKAVQTVNQIMEAAKAGDPQATQIAQMMEQVVKQLQGQATAAKYGAKLNYLQSLKCGGKTKAKKRQNGGRVCPECDKQVTKHQQGGSFYKNWSKGDIIKLQQFLSREDMLGDAAYKGDYDGKLGPQTIAAIKAYQKKHKITADGMWGYNTNQFHRVVDSSILNKGKYSPNHKTEQGDNVTYDVAGKRMTDQEYYKAINQLKERFYKDPEAFWNDNGEMSKWRQHLYTTPEGNAIIEEFYSATPDDVKAKIDPKKLSTKIQSARFNKDIRDGMDEAADFIATKALPVLTLPLAATAAPLATVTGLAGSAIGGIAGGKTWQNLHAGEERYNDIVTDELGNTAVVVKDPEQERYLQGAVVGSVLGGAAGAAGSRHLGKPGTRGMAGYRRTNNSAPARTWRSQRRMGKGRFGVQGHYGDGQVLDQQVRLNDGTFGYRYQPATPEYQAYLEGAGGNPSYEVVPIGMKNGGLIPRKK